MSPHPLGLAIVEAGAPDGALTTWEAQKRVEKGQKTAADTLDAVARSLPALMRAEKIQDKARKAGFDWDSVGPALDKLLGTASLSLCESEAVIASAFKENTGLRRFVRGHFCNGTVSLPEGHSSGTLLSLSGCNCLVDIPPNSPALHPGDRVTIILIIPR